MQAASVKHIPDYLPDFPEEEERRWWSLSDPLAKFILLSILLHTLAVLLFGAPMGGSSQGRALWGTLQVALRNVPPEPGPELKLDRTLPALSVPPPPAAAAPAEKTEAIAIPPLLDRIITPERELRPPEFQVPLPNEAPPAPLPPVERAPAPKPEVTPPAPPRVEVPPPRVEPVQRIEPPPRIEAPPVPTPALPRVAPLAAPAEPSLKDLPPLPAPVQAAPKLDALPVVPLPSLRAPVEVPAIPLAPVTPINVPPAFDRLPAQAAPPTLKELPAVERAVPAPQQMPEISAPLQRELPGRTEPFAAPIPAPPPRDAFPSSDSGSRFRTAPPPAADPLTSPLDLDAMRKRAAQITREGSGRKSALPFPMPAVPDKKTALETAIENARKPDCKTAYKDLGLLAALPLIMNEFGEGNCRW